MNIQCKENHKTIRIWKARNDERQQLINAKGSINENLKGRIAQKEKND